MVNQFVEICARRALAGLQGLYRTRWLHGKTGSRIDRWYFNVIFIMTIESTSRAHREQSMFRPIMYYVQIDIRS